MHFNLICLTDQGSKLARLLSICGTFSYFLMANCPVVARIIGMKIVQVPATHQVMTCFDQDNNMKDILLSFI